MRCKSRPPTTPPVCCKYKLSCAIIRSPCNYKFLRAIIIIGRRKSGSEAGRIHELGQLIEDSPGCQLGLSVGVAPLQVAATHLRHQCTPTIKVIRKCAKLAKTISLGGWGFERKATEICRQNTPKVSALRSNPHPPKLMVLASNNCSSQPRGMAHRDHNQC
jgi:hypothetical protein